MNSPDPITVASMIGGLSSAWRVRAVGIPIARAAWRTMVGFCAKSLLDGRAAVGGAPTAAQSTIWAASDSPRLSGSLPWTTYGIVSSDVHGPRLQKSSGIVEWELSGGGSLSSNSKGGARSGMPNLDYLLEVGPKAKITVAKPTDSSRLSVDVALREAISTNFSSRLRSQGALFEPDVAYEERAIFGSQWSGRASIGAQFATASLQRYYYEVEPQYALPGRPAYDARAGYWGATLSLTAFRQVTRSFTVFVGLDVDNYDGAANVDSPLLRTRNDLGVALGFAWSIGQSKQEVNRAR